MDTTDRYSRRRRRSITIPLIIVTIGVVLLLQNLGLISWGTWGALARLWPLILVLFGLEMILQRISPVSTFAVGVLFSMVIVGAVALSASRAVDVLPPNPEATVTNHLSEPIGTVQQATLNLQFGVGELNLDSLPADSPSLIEADFRHVPGNNPITNVQRRNGVARIEVGGPSDGWLPFGDHSVNHWNLSLSQNVPLDLELKTGASSGVVNLSDLQVTRLRVDAGASDVTVRLPRAAGMTRAVVKAGAATITIEVPEAVAAKVHSRNALGSVDIDTERFPRVAEAYVSPDFDIATNRVELDIEAGAAHVMVRSLPRLEAQ